MNISRVYSLCANRAGMMALVLSFCSIDIFAANYKWDVSTSGGYQAGGGAWGTTTSDKYWTLNGITLVAWPGVTGHTATFNGSDGAKGAYWIGVSGAQPVDSIAFLNDGYWIGAGTAINFGSKNGIYVAPGKTGVIETPISGSAGLVKYGTGRLDINGTCTYTGGTAINAGGFCIGEGGATGWVTGNIITNDSLIFNRSDNITFSGDISGAGIVLKWGTGLVILTGTNTYTGITINGTGGLQIGNGGTSGSVAGQIWSDNPLTFNRSDNFTHSGNIDGTGTVTKSGGGILTLNGTNSYTGVTTISAGAIAVSTLANGNSNCGLGAAASTASNLVINGGTLRYIGNGANCDRLFTVGASGATIDASGTGPLNLSNSGSIAYSGSTTHSITLNGSYAESSNNFTPVIGNDGANAVSLAKSGEGTWKLASANTFTGSTTAGEGTLLVNGSTASGSAVGVSAGATLGGIGTISGNVTVGGTLSPCSTSASAGKLTLGGDLTFSSGSYYVVTVGGTTAESEYDQTALTGGSAAVSLGGGNATLSFNLNYAPSSGHSYTIIDNQGASATTTGYFSGLTEGATFSASYDGILYYFTISYQGGTNSNDVVVSISSFPVLTWDTSATSGYQAGGGAWGTDSYWSPNGTGLMAWPGEGTSAIFGGSDGAYTITVNGTQDVDSIAFNNGGYVLSGGAVDFGDKSGIFVADGKSAIITSAVSGSAGLTKSGNGQLTLTGTSTYTGTTTIKDGTLFVTGAIASRCSVSAGAILAGTGTIDDSVPVIGALSPGVNDVGKLTIGGNLILNSSATYVVTANGTTTPGSDYDQTVVTGATVSLGDATLSFTFGYDPAIGHSYTIIDNQGENAVEGTFSGIAQGGAIVAGYFGTYYNCTVSYIGGTGNDVVVTVASENAYADEYSLWHYSKNVYINTEEAGANIIENQVNFPLLVRLNSGNFNFSEAKTDGEDIRFAKSTGAHFPYQIERWDDVNRLAEIWVKIDTVKGYDDTQYFKMYWGKSTAHDSSSGPAVFDSSSGFRAVWHLKEDPAAGSGAIQDATIHANNGASSGDMTSADLVDGVVGKGIDFEGTDDVITAPSAASFKIMDSVTVSAWIKPNALTAYSNIATQSHSSADPPYHKYSLVLGDASNIVGDVAIEGAQYAAGGSTVMTTGNFYLAAMTFDGTTLRTFTNGFYDGANAHSGTIDTITQVFSIGASGYSTNYFNGVIDEVVVSRTARSADWIKLCYETQKTNQTAVRFYEDYSQWSYSKDFYLNTKAGGANVSNAVLKFPVLLRLDSTGIDFTEAKDSGQDIRFSKSDGITPLSFEIEQWDKDNKAAAIWVLVDTVYGNDSTRYFTMYWGKSDATSMSNGQAVFDSSNAFRGVWHMNNDPSGGDGAVKDATVHTNNATSTGGMTSDNLVTANIGKGIDLDGTDDGLAIYNSTALNIPGSISISAWIYARSVSGYSHIFSKAWSSAVPPWAVYAFSLNNSGSLMATITDGSIPHYVEGNTTLPTTSYFYVVFTYDGYTMKLFYNGTQESNTTPYSGTIDTNSTDPTIAIDGFSSSWFNGIFDEVVVSRAARSADWIRLCYENQKQNQTLVMNAIEDYSQWQYSHKININTSQSGANSANDVQDFPALIRLTSNNFPFSQAQDDGRDIRFAKLDGAKLSYEIGRWDRGNQLAEVWVLLDEVEANNGAQYIRMYWGKSGVTSKSNSNTVFDAGNGFVGVWHFAPGDTFGDATINSNSLTNGGSTPLTSSIIGYGRSLASASSHFLYKADANVLDLTGSITLSAWINCASISATMGIVGKDTTAYNLSIDGSKYLRMGINKTIYPSSAASNITTGAWNHVAAAFNEPGDSIVFYVNGQKLGTKVSAAEVPVNTATQLQIGARQNNQYFDGSIDEVRIISAYRSADFIKLCYENQKAAQTLIDLDDYDEWSFSRQLFINTAGMGLSGDVVKFPLLVRLDTTLIDFNQARDTGQDIRFSKADGTHLRYEIEKWDKTNKKAAVWVLVDTVKQNSGTQYIKMYWGKSDAINKSAPTAIFDTGNGYIAAYHLGGNLNDATSNAKNGTDFSSVDTATGNIGNARAFNGSTQYFQAGDLVDRPVGTISCWFRPKVIFDENSPTTQGIWGKFENNDNDATLSLRGDDYASGHGDGATGTIQTKMEFDAASSYLSSTTDSFGAGAWYYAAWSWGNNTDSVYINGTMEKSSASSHTVGDFSGSAQDEIGRSYYDENQIASNGPRYFNGTIDEFRICNQIRGRDWIKLCYETQKPNQTAIVVDSSAEMFLPLTISTYAVNPGDSLDSCIIATKKWTIKFDCLMGGGVKWLSPDSMGATSQLDSNLFYLLSNNHRSDTGRGNLKLLDSGKVFARLQQEKNVGGQTYSIVYTILGCAKAFIKVSTYAASNLSPTNGLEFRIANNATENITNTPSSATPSSCRYLLHSDGGTNRVDACLALFENWSQADAFTGAADSKYYGIKSSTWNLPAKRSQAWEFMIDFSHCDWNDTTGVGYRVNDYRTPDSMVFYAGTPLLEKSWERRMSGHWQFEEGSGDTTYDNSLSNNHGIRPAGATWTWGTGKWGKCLSLSGGSDGVLVADDEGFDHLITDGFTVCAWIKPAATLSSVNGIFKKYSTSGYSFTGGSGGVVQLRLNGGVFPGRTSVGSGAWRHVAAVYRNVGSLDTVKLYVDGKPDTIHSGGDYAFDTSNVDAYIGSGFSGLLDDVRFYCNDLGDEEIKAVYQLGYAAEQGMYIVRADNNNTAHMAIDGYAYHRYFPVFQVYNYWSADQPGASTPKVYMNGTKLTYEKDYFAMLDDPGNMLTIGFNSIISDDAVRLYISGNDTLSSEITTTMPKMYWGKITSPSSHFYVKNFSGNTFGNDTANQYYFDFKMGMGNTNTSNGGEIYRFKTSKISPYGIADTMSTGNLSADTMGAFGNFLYKIGSNWLKTTSKVTATPTYTVAESSIVRVIFQLNPRTIKYNSDSCVVISRLTMYPTGQMFRWDSVYAQSANIDSTRFNVYQKYVSSGGGTVDTLFNGFRGGHRGAENLQDYVSAFLRYSNSSAITNTPDGLIWINSSGTGVIGVRFLDNEEWTSAQKPHQTAYYLDIGKATLVAGSMDSISRGVRNSTGASSVRLAANGAGSAVTNSAGDFNNDAFNEKEGAYVYACDNANTAHFTLYANGDTCRFNPAFRLTNYTAVSVPQYVYVNSAPKIKDFNFNAYVKNIENELVLQLRQTICSDADIYISYDKTLAVTMTDFEARAGDAAVALNWNTESEENNLGFFLYRRIKPAFLDSVNRAKDSLIPASLDTMVEVTVPMLLKAKVIQLADTGWKQVNKRIIFGAMNGVSYGKRSYKWIDKQVYNDVQYEYKLVAVDFNSSRDVYDKYAFAQPRRILPSRYELWGNYPNPFRRLTYIKFDLPVKTKVALNVYNIQGRLIRRILKPDKPMKPGFYRVSWDGKNDCGRGIAAGPYIYRITADGFAKSKIMIFVK